MCGLQRALPNASKHVEISGSVTSLGRGAFHYCIALESNKIRHSVTTIEADAFHGCCDMQHVAAKNRRKLVL